jgi:hypothetical protein
VRLAQSLLRARAPLKRAGAQRSVVAWRKAKTKRDWKKWVASKTGLTVRWISRAANKGGLVAPDGSSRKGGAAMVAVTGLPIPVFSGQTKPASAPAPQRKIKEKLR